VSRLTFDVAPGTVTGFLGPNGAGKSATMRLIMGLDAPDAGSALIGGVPYHSLRWPLRTVGAALDARAFHPGRSGRAHLLALAAAGGIPRRRVEQVLDDVGLAEAAGRRVLAGDVQPGGQLPGTAMQVRRRRTYPSYAIATSSHVSLNWP
jgi:ABC-2 type transport system ATP-binding protein